VAISMAERGRRLTVPEVDRLVTWLVEDQQQRGLADEDYAPLLGMSRPHWVNLRTGRRRVVRAQAERICRFYPPARAAYIALYLERTGGEP
jgi:hypothetical protein